MKTCETSRRVAAVILAAGRSRRFGSNKLLHIILGKSILEWTIEPLIRCNSWKTAIVIPEGDELDNVIPGNILKIVNSSPDGGIGTSIALATKYFERDAQGILFLLADQPLLSNDDLRRFFTEFSKNPDLIIACSGNDEIRNPILFPSTFFEELIRLRGDEGARELAKHHSERLVKIPIDVTHLLDLDTMEDLAGIEKMLELKDREDY
ncbi:MAG: nucleotidyltransferase family protein [Thermoplasmatales archaeon]